MTVQESKPRRLFGVVKEFKQSFGFIAGADGGSHFCFWRDLPAAWRPQQYRDQLAGKSVTFEVQPAAQGRPKAIHIFVIDPEDEHLIGAEIDVADVRA